MKKKIVLTIMAVCLLTGCGKQIPKLTNGEDAVVTFKDGTKISINEIWDEMKDQYALGIILNKIDKKILEEEYKDKLDDAKTYITNMEKSIKSSYTKNGKLDEDSLNSDLNNAGFETLEGYLETQRISYLQNLAIEDYAKSKITEKQIKNYYKNESVGDISAVHILVKPASGSSTDDTKAKEQAEKIIEDIKKDIKSGTKALEAFKKYEKDTTVTYQDLGKFNKGDMVEAFEKAVFALKKGEYSKTPVKTSYGYHVILKTNEYEKEEYDKLKDDIKDELANKLIDSDSKTSVNALVELRKKYGVNITDSTLETYYNRQINRQLNQ